VTAHRAATHDRRGAAPGRFLLFQALVFGPLRQDPARAALALVAIALGVALGVAVHLINASAVNEFELASRHLAGAADLVIRGPRAGFHESLYPEIARLPQVEASNPAVEADVALAGRQDTLRIIGFDPLRAMQVQPELLPERLSIVSELFDADALLLSHAAANWLGLKVGDALEIRVGTGTLALKIVGLLPEGAYRQRLGVMDIASAQWRLERLGRLNRIDLRLKPGVNLDAFRESLQTALPPGVHATAPEIEAQRSANLTRAYRLNLDMLALVALLTGGFLVFSSQVLALLRRRRQFALLRTLGVTRGQLSAQLIVEGAAIGAVGAAIGVAAGYVLATYALLYAGPDLGAGYFRSIQATLEVNPQSLLLFFALGVGFAVLGAAAPAWETARRPPAQALRAGDEEESLAGLRSPWWGLLPMVFGMLLALAPAIDGLPLAGYLAVALILLGAVLLMPRVAEVCLEQLRLPRRVPAAIAIAQLKATPRQSAISIAAIVASFSLMVSMLIMVSSFRSSLESWLDRMLPADLYVRAVRAGDTGFLTPEEQQRIANLGVFERVEFLRSQSLLITAERAPVVLLARPSDTTKMLPFIGRTIVPQPGEPPPIWVSEVAADLYHWRVGDQVRVPIAGKPLLFTVAGIWRDYARQSGAIAMDRELYVRITGDRLVNDAAIWIAPGNSIAAAEHALRAALPPNAAVEIASTRELRASSLALFDRTFAITYVLEAVAVLIGLIGVSVSFGAQALARRRDFGVLRHFGMTRREIGELLACEGALVSALGATFGVAVGWLLSLILVHVINRQSFHWTMDVHVPWLTAAALVAFVVAAAAATAAWSGRAAMQEDVVRSVREDW
jgi:putative ABC transport system permease protein